MPDPPRRDPYKLAVWSMRVLATAMIETARGRGHRETNNELRAFASGIQRLIPVERTLEAEKTLRQASTPTKPGRAKGSEVVDLDEDEGLRK